MNIRQLFIASICLTVASAATAGHMRMADGKPCYPTEKTYYDKDGVTPFGCEPASGPAYAFKVWSQSTLLWEGELASSVPAVYFPLKVSSGAKENSQPRLVIRRDLSADPTGQVVFFGETHVESIKTLKVENGSTIQAPENHETGITVRVKPGSTAEFAFAQLPGSVTSQMSYRVELRNK